MKRAHKTWLTSILALMTLATFAVFSARPALAHSRVEIGPYVIIVGWESEPVVVGERNALFFEVTEGEEPVEGLEGTLDVVILYGGQTFTGNLEPTADPGVYLAEIMPTVTGQYSVQLSGAIEDVEVDQIVEPEEVLPAAVLQFPESPPDTRELQATINDLNSQLQTIQILAIVAIVIGLLGLGIAVISLVRGRQ